MKLLQNISHYHLVLNLLAFGFQTIAIITPFELLSPVHTVKGKFLYGDLNVTFRNLGTKKYTNPVVC